MTAIMIHLDFKINLTGEGKDAVHSIFCAFNYLQVEELQFFGTIVFSNCSLLVS